MAKLVGDMEHIVMMADVETERTMEEAAAVADVVIVSVPIDTTVELIHRIGPLVRAEALLMDVTSIKVAPVKAMLDSCRGSVVGLGFERELQVPATHVKTWQLMRDGPAGKRP